MITIKPCRNTKEGFVVEVGQIVSIDKVPTLVHTDYHPNFRGVRFHANGTISEGVWSKTSASPWYGNILISQEKK